MKKILLFLVFVFFGLELNPAIALTTFEGIVKPAHEVELALPLDGIVLKIFVKEGDRVKEGEDLLKLDDTLQKMEVLRRKEIFQDNAELEASKKNFEIVKTILESSRELYAATSSISQVEIQNLEMQSHTLNGKINITKARKKQERIEYEISKEVLARYVLKSPIDGVVSVIKHEAGEWAKTGEMIVTVVDTSVCYVEFHIDENFAHTLKEGKNVSLTVHKGEGTGVIKGKVVFVSPVADNASALLKIKVEFDNANDKVIPGVLANISIE